jgi:predicted HAD superfamily phosphohydrolase YqeG
MVIWNKSLDGIKSAMIGFVKRVWVNAEKLENLLDSRGLVETVYPDSLKKSGAHAVILDHDGVLGPIRSKTPDSTGEKLINDLVTAFGENKVFILSNTKSARASRRDMYRDRYKSVTYLMALRKPDPEGLNIASRLSGVPCEKIAVVDDGILTGGLMAVENGAIPVYATRKHLEENAAKKAGRLLVTLPQIAFVRLIASLKKGLTGP